VSNIKALSNYNDDQLRLQSIDGTLQQELASGGKLHDARVVGDRVWVAHAPVGAAGEIVVVDPTTAMTESIPTAPGAYGLAVSGARAYATCTESGRVQVFDASTHAVVEDIDLASLAPGVVNARGIAVAPSGDIFLESDGMLSALYR